MKTIAQQWAEFETEVMPAEAGAVQRQETKRAFYMGFWACLCSSGALADETPGDTQDELDRAATRWEALHEEARRFAKDVGAGLA